MEIRRGEVPPPEQGAFLILEEEPAPGFNTFTDAKKWGEWKEN